MRASRLLPARLRWLLGDRVNTVVALTATSMATGVAEAAILAILAEVASALVAGNHTVELTVGPFQLDPTIEVLLVVAFAVAMARIALGVATSVLNPRIVGNVQAMLRRELLASYMGSSWAVKSQDREGHLQELMTNQANLASDAAGAAAALVAAVFAFLMLVASALLMDPLAVLVVSLMAAALFGLMHPLRSRGRRRAQRLSTAQLEYAGAVGEANRMAEETHVFGVKAGQMAELERYIDRARDLFISTESTAMLVPNTYQSVLYLFIVLGLAIIYGTGVGPIASLGAVILILIRAGTYGQQVQRAYQLLHQALPFVERVGDAERRYALSTPSAGVTPLGEVETIGFEHVYFGYKADTVVLADLDFEVDAGQAIGIVGPSGAGKSSMVQILLRLREPTEGRYLVNGRPAGEFSDRDWQRQVAYVPQEPNILYATVAENIRYFRDIDDREVERAARLAHIHDEIESWTQGYETLVGPRAEAVSGGQQQRLCLARALAAKPSILILDEPTSALDPRSENLVKTSLDGLRGEMTIFVVAHGSTLLDICDRTMVVVDGRLEAFGSTSTLSSVSSYHRSITALAGA